MAFLVLGFPRFEDSQRAGIDELRSRYDELYYGVVEAHFTFVFPTVSVSQSELSAHVRAITAGQPAIPFALRSALVVQDAFQPHWHVFLVPDEGFSRMVKLHDRLYTGPLAADLRLDVPYIPHIGAGNSKDPKRCKDLADLLNAQDLVFQGAIEQLSIVSYENDQVTVLENFAIL